MLRDYLNTTTRNMRGSRVTRFATLLCLVSLCLTAGCRRTPETSGTQTGQTNRQAAQPNQQMTGHAQQDAASAPDRGDLKLRYQTRGSVAPRNAAHRAGADPQALQKIVADLNDRMALPFDIVVSFQDCEEADAFYDVEAHQVTICYQLVDEYYDLFSAKVKDKNRLDDVVRGATACTFFHELGHALVDAWQIPITGREEDAVDQLSTLVLIGKDEQGEQMALDGALSFMLYADMEKGWEKVYWDEHSLDEQRFYDTICLVYGHDPDKHAHLVHDGTLPVERAEMCREDYTRAAGAWGKLLRPYLKQSPPTGADTP